MNACIISSGVCGSKLQQGHRKPPRKREKKRGKKGGRREKGGERAKNGGKRGEKMGEGGYMRETGAVCQIGILAWKRCIFCSQKGHGGALGTYKNSECPFQSCSAFGERHVPKKHRPNPPQMLCFVAFKH